MAKPPQTEPPPGRWFAIDSEDALRKAFELADAHALEAQGWYANAMRRRGRTARLLRLLALLCFGLGSLFPIAKALLPDAHKGLVPSDLGYFALALGAALLGFDHFFGISSAYTRFVTTDLAIRNARLRFQTEWLALSVESRSTTTAAEPARLLHDFVETILCLVERETQEWVAEFRSSLAELERLARKQAGPPEPPGEDLPGRTQPVAGAAATVAVANPAPAKLAPRPVDAVVRTVPAPPPLSGPNGSVVVPRIKP